MAWMIVCDSSCEIRELEHPSAGVQFALVPFKIRVGEREYVDLATLNVPQMLQAMTDYNGASTTACPSPEEWAEYFLQADNCIALTISSNLSGSYNAAVAARTMVLEEYPEKKIFILDTLSCSGALAGAAELANKLIGEGQTFEDICFALEKFVESTHILFSTRTSYENQTKKAITNKFVSQAMTDFLKHYLEVYFLEKPEEAQKICQQVLVNKQSREHAEKTRQSIKKTLSTQIDLANRVQKFVDCRTRDSARRELYIVEGDSAMGAVKSSRDSEYQAIMPIRGKILNCLKADYARIFKSDVIVDLIKVMGCGVELGGKHNKELATFNLENLRFNKIVICTDADVDGYQIRTLVLTMLYRLTPTLINKGYVYIAESPLYEITTKDRTYFAYTEPEKAAFLEKIGDKKYTIQRSKGLGENDPEMMWLTTMNPESRRLIKVMPTDVVQTAQVFDILLGDNLAGRKEHIAQHGAEYLDDLDVS